MNIYRYKLRANPNYFRNVFCRKEKRNYQETFVASKQNSEFQDVKYSSKQKILYFFSLSFKVTRKVVKRLKGLIFSWKHSFVSFFCMLGNWSRLHTPFDQVAQYISLFQNKYRMTLLGWIVRSSRPLCWASYLNQTANRLWMPKILKLNKTFLRVFNYPEIALSFNSNKLNLKGVVL